jgi:putative acetyltransferase
MLRIRQYDLHDAPAIAQLFYETIHSINRKDYSEEEVRAVAPEVPDADIWHLRMSQRHTLVAEDNSQILAFAELESDGHLDMFYCRADAVGRGIGRQLYRTVEAQAAELSIVRLFAEVSITARPFFERCGFSIVQQQIVVRQGIKLTNYVMEKRLRAAPRTGAYGSKCHTT